MDREFDRGIWHGTLEWPDEWKPFITWRYVARKNSVECYAFAIIDGLKIRLDQEVSAESFPTNPGDWAFDEGVFLAAQIKDLLDAEITGGAVERIKHEQS